MAESSSEAGNTSASASLSPGGEFLFNISTDKVEVVELLSSAAVTVAALRAPDRTTAITLGALYFGYKLLKPFVDAAVKKALGGERDDQEVRDISPGSLLVKLHCFTDERFLEVLGYYESGEIKKRLEEEFSQIGIKVEGLKVKIENLAEVNAIKEAIIKRKVEDKDIHDVESDVEETADISTAAKEEGYDVSRFVGEVKEDLLCSICKCVPKDPRLCKNHDHIFCLAHISQHLKNSQTCPYCKDPLTLETLRRPTRFLKNYLDDLKIKCDHHDRGCPDVGPPENLPRHVIQCGYAPVMCGNEGCETIVNERDKRNHERSVCQFRIARWHEIKASQDEIKAISKDEIKASKDEIKDELNKMRDQTTEIGRKQDEMQIEYRELKQKFEVFMKKFDLVADLLFSKFPSSNKQIVIMGGRNHNITHDSVSIFNPANGTYAKLRPMNSPRHQASSCVYNNDVVTAGGIDGKSCLDNIEILKTDQDLLRWVVSRGKLPYKLYGHVLIVYQEKLLVIGGFNYETLKESNEIHELALDEPYTPTLLATMPQPRRNHTAEIVNGKLFILGGVERSKDDDKGNIVASVLMYDFIKKEFMSYPPLPKPVCFMSTVTRGNKIIVVGGEDKNDRYLKDVIMYDTETGRIENLPSLNRMRSRHSAVICDDVIVVLGGWNGKLLNSVESWKIDSDENWRELPSMPEGTNLLTAVVKP